MQVKIKYKRSKVPKAIAGGMLGMFIALAIFSTTEDSNSLFMLRKTASTSLEKLTETLKVKKDTKDVAASDSSSTTTTTTSGTSGLNLLLIAQMTEGYCKEYLEICKENVDGTLDTKTNSATVDIGNVIGINISESGFYSAGDGTTIPKSDIPPNSKGLPDWNNSSHSLKVWNKNNHASNGFTAVGGALQYTADNVTVSTMTHVSKYNKGVTTGGGGDCYLFPDAVVGLNGYLAKGLATLGITGTSLSDSAKNLLATISHNRGPGGVYMMFGIGYIANLDNKIKNSAIKEADVSGIADTIIEDSQNSDFTGDVATKLSMSKESNYVAYAINYISRGWYMNPLLYSNFKKHATQNYVTYWNCAFPKNQASSVDDVISKASKYVAKPCDVMKMSASECDKIFGTSNGDYANTGTNTTNRGYIFKKVRCSYGGVYEGGNPGEYTLICFETVAANHIYAAISASGNVYAKMLKFSGVGIDPTNPETYMNSKTVTTTTKNGTKAKTWTGDVTWINNYNVDTSVLTTQRMDLICWGREIVEHTQYSQARAKYPLSTVPYPSGIDCSGLIYVAYRQAGYNMTGFPQNTISYYGYDKFSVIKPSEMKPGDVFWYNNNGTHGHVEMYLCPGGSSGRIVTIAAHTWGAANCIKEANINFSTNTSTKEYKASNIFQALRHADTK